MPVSEPLNGGFAAQTFGSTTTLDLTSITGARASVVAMMNAANEAWNQRIVASGAENPVRVTPFIQSDGQSLSMGVWDGTNHFSVSPSQPGTFSAGGLSSATPYDGFVLSQKTGMYTAGAVATVVHAWFIPFAQLANLDTGAISCGLVA